MTTVVNKHGKPWDEFDRVVLEHCAQQLTPRGDGFSVVSEDGYPMFGFVPHEPCQKQTFVAVGWRNV